MTEATEGTGGKCGSALLNQRFRRYLKQKRGGDYWTDDRLVEAVNAFENVRLTVRLMNLGLIISCVLV